MGVAPGLTLPLAVSPYLSIRVISMGDYGRQDAGEKEVLGKAQSREQGGREGGRECQVGQGVPWAGTALDLLLQLGQTPLLHQLWVRLRILGPGISVLYWGRALSWEISV